MKPEELLANADFVRSLAKRLVTDEHSAADVTQEACLAALKNPPLSEIPLRQWLSRVTRNFVSNLRRNEFRRVKREREAYRPQKAPTAEEITEREEARSRVVEALQKLKEPYRSTILLRFYENQSARDVAEAEGIPLETVRTRLKRGIELLRKQLDADYGGNRRAWSLILAPLAGLQLLPASTAAATASASSAGLSGSGAGTIAASVKAVIVSALIVGAALIVWQLDPLGSESRSGISSAGSGAASNAEDRSPEGEASETRYPDRTRIAGRTVHDASTIIISGNVRTRGTDTPVTAFDFKLCGPEETFCDEQDPFEAVIHETVRHAEGQFSFSLERGGTYFLAIRSSNHLMEILPRIKVSKESGLTGLSITLDQGLTVSGRIVDSSTGRPVADVLVGSDETMSSFLSPSGRGFGYWLDKGHEEFEIHTTSDSAGRFSLPGLMQIPQNIAALHPGYAQAWMSIDPGRTEDVVFHLQSGYRIWGRALSDCDKPAAGLTVFMRGEQFPLGRAYRTDHEGRFETEYTLPGMVSLWIQSEDPHGGELRFTPEMKTVIITDHDEEVLFFNDSREYASWNGTVYSSSGKALTGTSHSLYLYPDKSYPWEQFEYLDFFQVREIGIDDQGRFEALKLLPGRYAAFVAVCEEGKERDVESRTITFERPGPVHRDIHLDLGSSISGTVVDEDTGLPTEMKNLSVLAVHPTAAGSCSHHAFVNEDGTFLFTGLVPGTFLLLACDGFTEEVVARLDGITVADGESVERVTLAVPGQGKVRIRLLGFDYRDFESFRFLFHRPGRSSILSGFEVTYADGQGTGEITKGLEASAWTFSFSCQTDEGSVFHCCPLMIRSGETTELVIDREALGSRDRWLSVTGRLTHADGSPVPGATLLFESPWHETVFADEDDELGTETDSAGRFDLASIKPGLWKVVSETAKGKRSVISDVYLPLDSVSPYPLDLVLPDGRVTGTLCSRLTGEPLESDRFIRAVSLVDSSMSAAFDSGSDLFPLSEQCAVKGSRFSIIGVPAGRFYLIIDAQGFTRSVLEMELLEDGEFRDVGEIMLDPCGLLDLEIVLPDGEPVEHFHLIHNDVEICSNVESDRFTRIAENRYLCDKLPLGATVIAIEIEGYGREEKTIDLVPGRTTVARIVLHP